MLQRLFATAVISLVLLGCSNLKLLPPRAQKAPRSFTEHGITRSDDYFWLREKDNPRTIAYLNAENQYTDRTLAPTRRLQKSLYHEFLSRLQEDDAQAPYRDGAFLYFSRTEKGKDYKVYCRKRSADAAEEVILDVNELGKSHEYVSVPMRAISDDGNLLAYGVSYSAFRENRLCVKDLRDGTITRLGGDMDISSIAWAADNQTVFFGVEDESKRPYRVYRQSLAGGEPVLVYEETDRAFNTGVTRTRSQRFIVIAAGSATTADAHFIPADSPTTPPTRIAERIIGQEYYIDDGGVTESGGEWFIRANDAGRNFRLVAAPIDSAGRANWKQVIAHREDVMIEDHLCFAGQIVLAERTGGLPRLTVLDRATKATHAIAMPEPIYTVATDHNETFDTPALRFVYESPITPSSTYEYDMASRTLKLLKRLPVPNYDASKYEVEQQFAIAADGARIPISIVRKKGLAGGWHPLWLYAYGAYGLPESDEFAATRFSLLDRGVIFAVAHIRGGGEMGKIWHEQGRLMQKRNTFTDFITCAEHLINQKITTPQKLAVSGFSAGGLTIGAVLNMRPDLFKCAIVGVPFVDVMNSMLDDSIPLTAQEYLEWGDPREKPAYDYMLSYSPYDNLRAQEYPAIFVPTGLDDSQVMYWEPAKYVAKLRTLKTDSNPLLLRCIMTGGHGGPSGRYDDLREEAIQQAFVLWQLGIEK